MEEDQKTAVSEKMTLQVKKSEKVCGNELKRYGDKKVLFSSESSSDKHSDDDIPLVISTSTSVRTILAASAASEEKTSETSQDVIQGRTKSQGVK